MTRLALASLLLTGCAAQAATSAPPPGAYDSAATPAAICTPGYTRKERLRDTYPLRDAVYNAYGLRRHHRQGYVIDHLIPLELGGLTTPANLWPQALEESYRKDADENRLHDAVCSGAMSLAAARAEMLKLWGPR